MIKAVIFDMDGIVIDSNHIHYQNWSEVFKKKFNITLPKEEFGLMLGKSGKHFTEYFIDKYHLNTTFQELRSDIVQNYLKLRNNITLKDGIKPVLIDFSKKYKIALATGALKEWADYILKMLNVNQYFDYVIGGDEVKEAKPDPEIFLRVAKYFSLKPEECVVVEDAILGIKAAKKAGMFVVSIQDEFTKYQDHSKADIQLQKISDLKDVNLGEKHV